MHEWIWIETFLLLCKYLVGSAASRMENFCSKFLDANKTCALYNKINLNINNCFFFLYYEIRLNIRFTTGLVCFKYALRGAQSLSEKGFYKDWSLEKNLPLFCKIGLTWSKITVY